jgi:putative spermidine/putrescine transport system substrate-binding protein
MKKTLALSLVSLLLGTSAFAQEKNVTIASWGGSY